MNMIVEDLTWRAAPTMLIAALTGQTGSLAVPGRLRILIRPEADIAPLLLFKGEEDAAYATYGAEVAVALTRAVAGARELLAEGPVHAAAVVDIALANVVLRRDCLNPHPHSSSWRSRPGFAAITNAELSVDPVLFIANALVHEAIHGALYHYEVAAPFTLGAVEDIRIVSPWTGASLRVSSYLHACHVWFGLAWLWRTLLDTTSISGDAFYFLDRARRGFAFDLAGPLDPAKAGISSDALRAVDEIQHRARAFA